MPKKALPPNDSESGINGVQVFAQQSRFANDAVDAPESKEILIKSLNISVGQRELLTNAEVHLQENHHYVLVGRNGEGKSTLLKAMADKQIPGLAWNLRILLLGQSKEVGLDDEIGGLKIEEKTVLQHVVTSNKIRERYRREAESKSERVPEWTDGITFG
jgi:ATP-binding cassette, subfamily F, member 3